MRLMKQAHKSADEGKRDQPYQEQIAKSPHDVQPEKPRGLLSIEPPSRPNLFYVVRQAMKERKPQPSDQIKHRQENNRCQRERKNCRNHHRYQIGRRMEDWSVSAGLTVVR